MDIAGAISILTSNGFKNSKEIHGGFVALGISLGN
jgi:rhodanese-related sulfurtransferase